MLDGKLQCYPVMLQQNLTEIELDGCLRLQNMHACNLMAALYAR